MQNIVRLLVVNPGAFIVQIVFVGHTVGIVTHGPVGGLGASQVIKEAFVDPVGKIISTHITDFGGVKCLEIGGNFVQGFFP